MSTVDWQRITERTECVSIGRSLVCVHRLASGGVVLTDAGAVESPELVAELERRGMDVRALLITHLHFDHISTAGLLWERFKMPCYASALSEKEPKFPTRDFPVTPLQGTEPVLIEGESFAVLPLPGHSKGHLGFVSPDGVCCVGDAFITAGELRGAKIPYMIDVEQAIKTMELVRETNYRAYVLCHEGVLSPGELDAVIDANIEEELRLYRLMKDFVTGPVLLEDMVTEFMKLCGIRSNFILTDSDYRATVKSRAVSLDYAGELRIKGEWIMPR